MKKGKKRIIWVGLLAFLGLSWLLFTIFSGRMFLYRSEEKIKEKLLEQTPVGTSLSDAKDYLKGTRFEIYGDSRVLMDSRASLLDSRTRLYTKGEYVIKADLGEYQGIPSEEYLDLGVLKVTKGESIPMLNLPYAKPQGIDTIWGDPESVMLKIDKLVVDGKRIRGRSNWMGADEMGEQGRRVSVDLQEEFRFMEMDWEEIGTGNYDRIIFREFAIGYNRTSKAYVIEYGAREVLMTYRVIYPGYYKKIIRNAPKGVKRRYYVRWVIEWGS